MPRRGQPSGQELLGPAVGAGGVEPPDPAFPCRVADLVAALPEGFDRPVRTDGRAMVDGQVAGTTERGETQSQHGHEPSLARRARPVTIRAAPRRDLPRTVRATFTSPAPARPGCGPVMWRREHLQPGRDIAGWPLPDHAAMRAS